MFGEWERGKLKDKIKEIYFSYGKDMIRLQEYSRYFSDINLHIKTINCKDKEKIDIILKTADNQSFAVCAIIQNNEAVIENVFKKIEEKI